MRTYEQVKKQHDILWRIAPAYDMTGAYVDSKDLKKLLDNPNKKTAKECMEDQIRYWFQVGPDPIITSLSVDQILESNKDVREIAKDYGFY